MGVATDDVTTMATSTTAAALLLSDRRLNVRRTAHVNAATVMSYLGLPVHTAASEEADERLETEAMAQSHNNKLKRQQGWVIILFRVVTTINNLQVTTAVITYNPPL